MIGKVKLIRSTTQVCTINSMIVFHYFIFIFLFLGDLITERQGEGDGTRSNFAYTCRTDLFNDGCSSRKEWMKEWSSSSLEISKK